MNQKLLRNTILVIAVLLVGFIIYKYRMPRFVAGEKAPDFSTTLIDGSQAQLSDLKGKYCLIQFWGSWCGPCRKENPQLVQLYQQYHDQGFEIFSIAIERNENAWKKAIQQDGLIWKYHSADFKEFDGQLAVLFNIKSIPTTFLINQDGQIMGVNLSPAEIGRRLGQALTK
jgi:thiol-disulfide isomerase/thioredoxin